MRARRWRERACRKSNTLPCHATSVGGYNRFFGAFEVFKTLRLGGALTASSPAFAADGGLTDLYFGPTPAAGKPDKNWIKTIPGKGGFTYVRLYRATQPYFDKSWQPPDIVEMKS
jgi:hypothetical protein